MKITFGRLLIAVGAMAFGEAVLGAVLFLAAGRWDLRWFWAYVTLYGLLCFFGFLFLDAGLLRERFRPGAGARDKVTVGLSKALSFAHYVIAGIDVGRFGWSGDLAPGLQGAAVVVVALCGGVTIWTMAINPFFSAVVRIQEERGHHLISTGPYRIVRHPGYVVIAVLLLASGVALGSWWSVLPNAITVLVIIRRTALEDAFLLEHLEGYADYARQVRYGLFPAIW